MHTEIAHVGRRMYDIQCRISLTAAQEYIDTLTVIFRCIAACKASGGKKSAINLASYAHPEKTLEVVVLL